MKTTNKFMNVCIDEDGLVNLELDLDLNDYKYLMYVLDGEKKDVNDGFNEVVDDFIKMVLNEKEVDEGELVKCCNDLKDLCLKLGNVEDLTFKFFIWNVEYDINLGLIIEVLE